MPTQTDNFKSAASIQNGAIAYCRSRIEQQKLMLLHVHGALPPALAEHALHCVIRDKKLLIYTDTPAWASQLRFYHSAILAAIAPVAWEPVSMIQIKIELGAIEGTAPRRKPMIPSAEKIAQLRQQSLAVSDRRLKASLLKLSTTLAKLSDLGGRPG